MATEKRLIDADELESYLWALFRFFGSLPCSEADKATQRTIRRCIGEVKKMPTVDAVEVVHGRWEDVSLRFAQVKEKCTVCGGIVYAHGFNYCPNCGAKMDKSEKA